MTADDFFIVGHRGWPQRFPENSLVGLRAAAQSGAAAVELDVQLTADKECVVLHDHTLERVASDSRAISELTLVQLSDISIHEQVRFGDRHYPTPLSTLTQVCEALADEPVSFFIELKKESLAYVSESEFVQLALEQSVAVQHQRFIISFSEKIVEIAKKEYGEKTGWVLSQLDKQSLEMLRKLSPDIAIINYKKIPTDTSKMPKGPWSWFVYDVVDKRDRDWCIDIGVSYIETWDIAAIQN